VPPRYPWADVYLPHEGFLMLAYLQPFCNCFPVGPPPGRRRPAAASRRSWDRPCGVTRLWRMRDPAHPAFLQWSLHTARAPLHTPSAPDAHARPLRCSAPRLVWALPARSMCRRYGVPTTPSATRARDRGCASRCSRLRRSDAPGTEGPRVLGLAWCGEKCSRGLGRSAPVVWGEVLPWFGEKCSRGLGRSAPWFEKKCSRGLRGSAPWFGEKIRMISHSYFKDCTHWTSRRLGRRPHTTPCV